VAASNKQPLAQAAQRLSLAAWRLDMKDQIKVDLTKLKPIARYEAVERPRQANCEVCHGKPSWLKCVCMVESWVDVPVK
jgi:hypothetical protein